MISNEKYFFTVGFSEWGRWQVRKALVTDPYKYTLVEDLGPELHAVAIEADGEFTAPTHLTHFELNTEDAPWLAVVTTSKKLYVKKVAVDAKPNLDTAQLLSENVEAVSLCRGWRSTFWEVDAGVMCAYLKTNGDVCIRCFRLVSGTRIWDDEQLIVSNCTAVQAVRLNDYRMGIYVDPGHRLFLSERYYLGGTARTEWVYADIINDFNVFSSPRVDEPNSEFEITEVIAQNPKLVRVTGNYPFFSKDPRWADVQCLSNNTVTNFYIQNGYLFIELENPISTALGYARFKIPALNRVRFERTPQSRPVVPELIFDLAQPIPVIETANVQITTSAIFHEVTPEHFKANPTEVASVNIATAVTYSTVEMTDLGTTHVETASVRITNSAMFNETLVGDVPV